MLDISKIRKKFPILSKRVNGHDLVYFDNGATTQKPQSVINAESNYYQNQNSNVHRGVHFLSGLATDKFEEARKTVKNFINAKHLHEIIFTKGTTDSINLVANGYKSLLNKGDEIIISELEHHSNIVPWQMCCEQSGAILKVIPLLDNGTLDMIEFENLISKGGEGIMLRAPKSPYEGKRTAHLLKYKKLYDAECKIIGYKNTLEILLIKKHLSYEEAFKFKIINHADKDYKNTSKVKLLWDQSFTNTFILW